jgi:hypothetical protein
MTTDADERTRRILPGDRQWWFGSWMAIGGLHPAAVAVREFLPASVCWVVSCPHCAVEGGPVAVLDHLLRRHACSMEGAAEWLETIDGDLFSLAVHYLASQARRPPAELVTAATPPH